MRIKDYTDTIRHLTDSFNIPEARRMIQENPALTQEQFKAGGIVEPGVTHYATRGGPRGDPSDPARQFTQKKNKWDRIKIVIDEVAETGDINILKSQTRKTGGKLTMNQANILSDAATDADVFN